MLARASRCKSEVAGRVDISPRHFSSSSGLALRSSLDVGSRYVTLAVLEHQSLVRSPRRRRRVVAASSLLALFLAPKTKQTWQRLDTHTHPFNGPFSGTTQVSRYQKCKTNLDFSGASDSEWQWHQLGHMQVCTSPQTDNHTNTPPLLFYRPDALPATQPTASKH